MSSGIKRGDKVVSILETLEVIHIDVKHFMALFEGNLPFKNEHKSSRHGRDKKRAPRMKCYSYTRTSVEKP